MFDPPDGLLEELRGAGRVESSGSFTVDRERAAALLARLRFQSPYEYVLKLVQHAVAGGAGQVWVAVFGGGMVWVWYDRAVLAEADLADLSRHALEPIRAGPRRHLTYLAEGLQAAQALRPSVVEVAVGSRTEAFRLLRDPDGERLERLGSVRGDPWTRIRLKGLSQPWLRPRIPAWTRWTDSFGSRSLGDLYGELEAWRDSEYSQVWRRCVFAPVPVLLNRRVVNRPFFGLPSAVTRWTHRLDIVPADLGPSHCCVLVDPSPSEASLPAPRALPEPPAFRLRNRSSCWATCPAFPERVGWQSLPQVTRLGATTLGWGLLASLDLEFQAVPAPPPFGILSLWGMECLAAHALLGRGPGEGWLAWCRDGVVLSRHAPPADLRGWRIVCRADELALDLSGMEVVQDDVYRGALDALSEASRLV